MKEILELIEKGDFSAALPKAERLKAVTLARFRGWKAGLFFGGLLLFALLTLTALDLLLRVEGAEIVYFANLLSFLEPAFRLVNGLIASVVGSEPALALSALLWLALSILAPAVLSVMIAVPVSLIPAKLPRKPMGTGSVSAAADEFKQRINFSYPDSPGGKYATVYALVFVIAVVGGLAYSTAMTEPNGLDGATYAGIAICIVLGFILFRLLYKLLFSLCEKLTELVTPAGYSAFVLCEKADAYLSVYHKEQEALCKQREKELKEKAEEKKRQDEERKRQEEKKRIQQLDASYRQLLQQEPVDEKAVRALADLGHPMACAWIGERLYAAYTLEYSTSANYTREEKKQVAQEVLHYLRAAPETDLVSKALSISLDIQFNSFTYAQFREMLQTVRKAKASGLLKQEYIEVCDAMIPLLVEMVDSEPEEPAYKPEPVIREPRITREYCAFCAGGTCGYYSTSCYLAKCDHLNDPGSCSAALSQKALRFEFD